MTLAAPIYLLSCDVIASMFTILFYGNRVNITCRGVVSPPDAKDEAEIGSCLLSRHPSRLLGNWR